MGHTSISGSALAVPLLLAPLALLALLAPLAPLGAQNAQGSFLVTAPAQANLNTKGGLFLVTPLAGTVTSLNATGDLANSHAIDCDPYDDTLVFVGTRAPAKTAAPSIHRVLAVAGKIIQAIKLPVALTSADQTVMKLQVLGDHILFLTSTQLSLVPRAGGKTRVLLSLNSSTGMATDFTCNGREVFLHVQPTASIMKEHIYAVDLETPALKTVIYACGSLTHMISSLNQDSSGNLLMVETEVFSAVSLLKVIDDTGKVLRTLKLTFPAGGSGARMDPNGSTLLVMGKRYDTVQRRYMTAFITLLNWKVFKTEFGASPELFRQIAVRRPVPLHRYGHNCKAKTNYRAEISASGLPLSGNVGYKLSIAGPPTRSVILMLGLHGALPAPYPLAAFGAGTCELGVLPLLTFAAALDATGNLTLPLPLPPGLAGLNVDAQWVVVDLTANLAGVVTSQTGSITIR